MNQGPRYVRLMEKSRGQKSRATVPLISYTPETCETTWSIGTTPIKPVVPLEPLEHLE